MFIVWKIKLVSKSMSECSEHFPFWSNFKSTPKRAIEIEFTLQNMQITMKVDGLTSIFEVCTASLVHFPVFWDLSPFYRRASLKSPVFHKVSCLADIHCRGGRASTTSMKSILYKHAPPSFHASLPNFWIMKGELSLSLEMAGRGWCDVVTVTGLEMTSTARPTTVAVSWCGSTPAVRVRTVSRGGMLGTLSDVLLTSTTRHSYSLSMATNSSPSNKSSKVQVLPSSRLRASCHFSSVK